MADKHSSSKPTFPLYVKIIAGITSVLVFCLIAEIVLRLIDTNVYYKNQFFPVNRDIDFTEVYKKDKDLFWRFRTNKDINSKQFSAIAYHINSTGQRGPDIASTKPDIRIVALGNSCTFGWGVPYDNTWVYLLQELLRAKLSDTAIEVINAGVPGYSSYQGRKYYERYLYKLHPDIMLIMFGWNDHWAAGDGIPDAAQETPPQWVLALHNMISPFKLYQFMRKVVLSASEEEKEVPLDDIKTRYRVSVDEFYMNLRSIIRKAKDEGTTPVLLVPPVASLQNYFNEKVSPFHAIHKRYQQEIRRVAQREGVPLVDLQIVFDQYNDLFDDARHDPIHFNAKGHAITAQTIAEPLIHIINGDYSPQKIAGRR